MTLLIFKKNSVLNTAYIKAINFYLLGWFFFLYRVVKKKHESFFFYMEELNLSNKKEKTLYALLK